LTTTERIADALAVVEAEEVEAAMQTSDSVQAVPEDSENSATTEPCRRLLYEIAECGDSQLTTQPSTASDCRTSASDEEEIDNSLQLSLSSHSVEKHIIPVAGASQQLVLI